MASAGPCLLSTDVSCDLCVDSILRFWWLPVASNSSVLVTSTCSGGRGRYFLEQNDVCSKCGSVARSLWHRRLVRVRASVLALLEFPHCCRKGFVLFAGAMALATVIALKATGWVSEDMLGAFFPNMQWLLTLNISATALSLLCSLFIFVLAS